MIDDHYYRIYYTDCVKLAMTVVVKLNTTIDMINQLIKLKYGEESVDTNDPSSWKWYLNVSGEYHFSDTMMYVRSLDTQEEIPFTKWMLDEHPATREAYQFGTRYCRLLLEKYPEQETLIMGILYPADSQMALDAVDGDIISYPKELVESQEETLIEDLSTHIKNHLSRWRVEAFAYTHSLYLVSESAVLYTTLLPKILSLRVARCKTHEAHSFHIRMYLASHGRLDQYLPYMTLRQALFLYRNINYIEKHGGRLDTFYWLIERLLTERNIPISEFSIRHLDSFREDYRTNYLLRKKPINTQYNVPEKDFFTLDEVLSKEVVTAPYNETYSAIYRDSIDTDITNSPSSVVQTKDLESSMVDRTDSRPYTLSEVLIDHWAYLSQHGGYRNVYVVHKDVMTGELVSLSTRDAFIYFMYVLAMRAGITLEVIPSWYANKIIRHPRPSVVELKQNIATQYLPQPNLAESLLQQCPRYENTNSRLKFYQWGKRVYESYLHHVGVISNTQTPIGRGMVKMVCDRLTMSYDVVFEETGSEYEGWLAQRGLSLEGYEIEDIDKLIKNLIEGSTGHRVDETKLLKNIQRAMIAILRQLSSYSIQLISSINEMPIRPINWGAIRLDTIGTDSAQSTRVKTCYQLLPTVASLVKDVRYGNTHRLYHSRGGIHHVNINTGISTYRARVGLDIYHRVNTRIRTYCGSDVDYHAVFNSIPKEEKEALFYESLGTNSENQIGMRHIGDIIDTTISLQQLFKDS